MIGVLDHNDLTDQKSDDILTGLFIGFRDGINFFQWLYHVKNKFP